MQLAHPSAQVERVLMEELEQLRRQLAERPAAGEDPYVAQLEAEIAALKFEALAKNEAHTELIAELSVARLSAARVVFVCQ